MSLACEWCAKPARWAGRNSRTGEDQHSCDMHLSYLFAWDVERREPLENR